ncbi:MAG: hypothetical protein HQL86_09680 [Magnetococcales bacterium]|nr:hypothetical protein [Magnetococcales bacterium]
MQGTGDEFALGWVGRVMAAALQSGHEVTGYNLGVRRDTSRDILARFAGECAARLPEGCEGRIVLSCGANDTMHEQGLPRVPAEESVANLRTILARALPHGRLVIGPPPVGDVAQNRRIQTLARAFAHTARHMGVGYIDLFGPLVADVGYLQAVANRDGAHPDGAGYARMAQRILASPDWWFPAC